MDVEGLVIDNLREAGGHLLQILERDTSALKDGVYNPVLTADCYTNLRIITAINEVLLYYGDAGLLVNKDSR